MPGDCRKPSADVLPAAGGIPESSLCEIPRSYAAVCVRDVNQRAIALAASADARTYIAERLGSQAEGMKDLRSVAETCEVWRCDSLFEADLFFMDLAFAHDPGVHEKATRRLNIWWLGTKMDARAFEWSWEQDPRAFDPGVAVVGPFVDKHKVKKHAANLDAAFELCRFPGELHRAPRGEACVYKEMGRCPAACDGSESLEAYEQRLAEALSLDAERAGRWREAIESQMKQAAADGAYEEAGALKERLSRVHAFGKRQLEVIGRAEDIRYLAVTRSGQGAGHAALLVVEGGRWARAGTITSDQDVGQFAERAEGIRSIAEAGLPGEWDAGVLATLSRELLRPSKGGPVLIRLEGLTGPILASGVKRALRQRRGSADAAGETSEKGEEQDTR